MLRVVTVWLEQQAAGAFWVGFRCRITGGFRRVPPRVSGVAEGSHKQACVGLILCKQGISDIKCGLVSYEVCVLMVR